MLKASKNKKKTRLLSDPRYLIGPKKLTQIFAVKPGRNVKWQKVETIFLPSPKQKCN